MAAPGSPSFSPPFSRIRPPAGLRPPLCGPDLCVTPWHRALNEPVKVKLREGKCWTCRSSCSPAEIHELCQAKRQRMILHLICE
eukprot:3352749-Alexandrium_andersonii.AAC.1